MTNYTISKELLIEAISGLKVYGGEAVGNTVDKLMKLKRNEAERKDFKSSNSKKALIWEMIITKKRDMKLEIDRLEKCLERMNCGCLGLDCREHGSYDVEDLEFVNEVLRDK